MKHLSSDELHKAVNRALDEVERRLASGELDGSGRYWTDEELALGAATGKMTTAKVKAENPAAWPRAESCYHWLRRKGQWNECWQHLLMLKSF